MPRLLFDEQLSEALCDMLSDVFPGALHVRTLGHQGASDELVWALALRHGCIVVSKDEDFHRLALLRGTPPKFVWIRLGNCTTEQIAQLIQRQRDDIVRFDAQHEASVLELG